MSGELRIGLIDGDDLIRAGRRLLIDSQFGLKVVFEEANADRAFEKIPQLLLDVLVIDHRLQGSDGITLAAKLVEALSADGQRLPAIIVTGPYFTPELQLAAIRAGATDLVTQDSSPEELLKAIRSTEAKDDEPDFRELHEFLRTNADASHSNALFLLRMGQVPDREKRLLDLFACGLTDDEIAARMDLPRYRVRKVLQAAVAHFSFATRSQLFLALFESGVANVEAR